MTFADLELPLPFSSWAGQDWRARIHEVEGLQRRVRQSQELAVNFAKNIEVAPTTAEKIAWCLLWSRAFGFLQSASVLHGTNAESTAEHLYRPMFETWIQVMAIKWPWEQLNSLKQNKNAVIGKKASERAWADVADRLRGYLAWSIASDIVYERNRQRPSELRALYQAVPPERRSPEQEALHSYLFGETEFISDNEARQDRIRAQQRHEENISRLTNWLSAPELERWATRLGPWVKEGESKSFPTFFALLDPSASSMAATLTSLGIPELYAQFARDSLMLHGASLSLETHYGENAEGAMLAYRRLLPLMPGETPCENLVELAHSTLLGLTGMMPYVVPGIGSLRE